MKLSPRRSSSRRKSWGRARDATDEKFLAQIETLLTRTTQASLPTPDWALNLQLCDLINQHPERLGELAIKAVDRRLKAEPVQHKERLHLLIVLDMLVKNCGKELHAAVAQESFVATLLDLAGKKIKSRFIKKGEGALHTLNYEKELVQEKVLSLLQSWGPLHEDEMPIFNKTYTHLRAKGVKFPNVAPEDETIWSTKDENTGRRRQESFEFVRSRAAQAAKPSSLDPKLASELDGIKQTAIVLDDIVRELAPGDDAAQNEIAVQCADTLKEASKRVHTLFGEHDEDDVLALLLLVNERINASLAAFDNHSGERRIGQQQPQGEEPELDDDDDDDDDEGENSLEEWKAAVGGSSPLTKSNYASAGLLDIPAASDNIEPSSAIAIGLDYLESLSSGNNARSSSAKDDDFEAWLLGSSSPSAPSF